MPLALKPKLLVYTGSFNFIARIPSLKVAVAFHTPARLVIPVVAKVTIAGLVIPV